MFQAKIRLLTQMETLILLMDYNNPVSLALITVFSDSAPTVVLYMLADNSVLPCMKPLKYCSFADQDECQVNNGGCSHQCEDQPMGFFCDCPDNMRLVRDSQCEGE